MQQTFYDPTTGETFIVINEDDGLRNASRDHRGGSREHRGGGVQNFVRIPSFPSHRPPSSSSMPPRPRSQSEVVRHHSNVPQHQQRVDEMPYRSAEYVSIRKAALAEAIPVLGQLWASFLGRPEMPAIVGDHVLDRTNAAMHRDALAEHQQNQTRILALSDLAARAVQLLVA